MYKSWQWFYALYVVNRFPILVQVVGMILNLKWGVKIHNPCTSLGFSMLKYFTFATGGRRCLWDHRHPLGRGRGWQRCSGHGILKSSYDESGSGQTSCTESRDGAAWLGAHGFRLICRISEIVLVFIYSINLKFYEAILLHSITGKEFVRKNQNIIN